MSRTDALRYAKPDTVLGRDAEWEALTAFASDPRPGPGLGVVSGRLRQGKTHLLRALTEAAGGFWFGAQEAVRSESLRMLGERIAEFAEFAGAPVRDRPRDWEAAVDALLGLGEGRPLPVVVDEFPRLVRQSPSLPSVICSALRRRSAAAGAGGEDGGARPRLLLCGSDLPVMRRLFSGPSPLHGLADLEMEVRPPDFRQAARMWGLDDPRLAFLVHAVVGGTPAYRYDHVRGDTPGGPDGFDDWVCRTALDPGTPLYREARLLLLEETDHLDRARCQSALAAVASGHSTPGEIAEYLDVQLPDVSHCLEMLHESGLLGADPDALRPNVTRLRIAEPLLAFEYAVVRPRRPSAEREDPAALWRRVRPAFGTRVAAPHFAQVCRDWAVRYAGPGVFGEAPATALHGSPAHPPPDAVPAAEVVVRGPAGERPGALLSVGLARWDEVLDVTHLERLRRLIAHLAAHGEDTARTRPACYSGAGFTPALRAAEADGEVLLVGLDRLYGGRQGGASGDS
ncbi:ATP-binding protein [Streptomyces verrucosisporus]|uniref:AAA family ATPase n=1 Tax=Streptomyces verrucosisporus TaxID=1695161 RepID=UPI0019D1992A|nr:ATP-binding protein [Streptomyces verrucosisporus]MBN3931888.1 ATP-binding protein [Streptomyces verrucosisporus]